MLDRPTTRAGWLARAAALKIEGRAFIDGAYVAAADGATFAKVSPIDGNVFAHVADCGATDIDRAVHSARRAFESGVWRNADPARKKKVLLRFADLIREHGEELALLETLDVGKPIANALAPSRSAPTASSTMPNWPTSSPTKSRQSARTMWRWW
jgi:4-(gamma-glutamylamino)butanal dehydrogenase